jgi:hypothetical protein
MAKASVEGPLKDHSKDGNPLTQDRSHPNNWYNRAADLHASAGAVWFAMKNDTNMEIGESLGFDSSFSLSVACRPVYHMLCGLALEVGAKSVLASRGATIPINHDLNSLVGLIGLTISVRERALLKYYSASVVWAGRYPTPRDCTDQDLRDFYSKAGDALTEPVKGIKGLKLRRGSGATNWEVFDDFWQRVMALRKREEIYG